MAWSAALIAEKKRRGGRVPIILADLLLGDGSYHYWATAAGNFPKALGAPGSAAYSPWIKSAGPFRLSRSLRSDAGDLVVQNLSGNTLQRDVAAAVQAREFIGALTVVRFWHPLIQEAEFEFHGFLTKPKVTPTEASFRILQLLDTNVEKVPSDSYSEQCTWRYKGKMCGSTGSATSCPKDFASCQDATRAAVERFNGTPHVPTSASFPHHIGLPGSGGGGSGGGVPLGKLKGGPPGALNIG